jgi:hypothetical protein
LTFGFIEGDTFSSAGDLSDTSKEFFGSCPSTSSSSRVCVTSLMTDELLIRGRPAGRNLFDYP